jgi:hypothetical protein
MANHFTGVKWKEKSSDCSVRNKGIAARRRDERQERRPGWAKKCGTGCHGTGWVIVLVASREGRGVPSRTNKPAMTSSEASVRLSSRAYFALSLFTWRVRPGLRDSLFKIAHFSKQRRRGWGRRPPLPSSRRAGMASTQPIQTRASRQRAPAKHPLCGLDGSPPLPAIQDAS